MCGRFTLMMPWTEVARLLGAKATVHGEPNWNVVPMRPIAILADGQHGREIVSAAWGIKGLTPLSPLINVHAENVGEKEFLKESLAERRCLIPATGFYEWLEKGGRRTPYHFTRPDGMPFVFAGLGRSTGAEDGAAVQVAILTTKASNFMKSFHHRMPVIMPPETWDAWLDCRGTSSEEAVKLLGPAPDNFLVAVAVSDRVNSLKNNDAGLIEPAGPPERAQ